MKKYSYLVFVFVVLIGLFLVYGSGEKGADITGDLDLKGKPGENAGIVKPDVNFGKIPLYFIHNKGQVNKKAAFYARASRYTLWITKEGLVFDSMKRADNENPKFEFRNSKQMQNSLEYSPITKYQRDVSRFVFINAKKNPEMVPIGETRLKVNYFKGNNRSKWHCDVPTSPAVLYKGLYKNIDLKVYGIEKQVEYDWMVKPGGDPGDIRFHYKNVKGTRLDEQGNLLIETDFGRLIHKRPDSYQYIDKKRITVKTRFKKFSKDTYGFEVEEYDRNCELIIDPLVVLYSTYLGGSVEDTGYAVAVDNSGYVYVAGHTYSPDFPVKGQYMADPGDGYYDVFVTKLDTAQSGSSSLIYSTYLGGSSDDSAYGIAVDNAGNAYVAGRTYSTDYPCLNQYMTEPGDNSNYDVIVTRLDTAKTGESSFVYSTYLGGNDYDCAYGIAVDANGYAYVAGQTWSTDFPCRNQYQLDQDSDDVFVTKLDTNQSGEPCLLYSTYLGGSSWDGGLGIAVDGSENAYVTGYTYSTNFPCLNQYQTDPSGSNPDAFVTRIDTTREGTPSLIYSTYLGGYNGDRGQGIAVDAEGYVYLTGYTGGATFPLKNQYQANESATDAFVTKLDTGQSGEASLLYSTYLGGQYWDEGSGIDVDNNGNAYVTGYTESTDFPILKQYQPDQESKDVFVTKIDTTQSGSSSLVYSSYLGGSNDDWGYGIAVDSSGNVYVTGETRSTDFPTLNQYMTDPGDSYTTDAFLTKLNIFETVLPTVTTTSVSSITTTSASGGGEVTSDGGAEVTARGVCWSTSENPTTDDSHTTDGSGTGVFTSSLTNLTPNTVYYVRAYATNSVGTAYGNEETFETDDPSITVTSPNGGEQWEKGSQQTITWTSDAVEGNVKIEYSIDNGENWTEIAASTDNDGSFPWTVPNVDSNQCLIRVSETDGSPADTSDAVFTIFPPSITVTSPNGGENWEVNSLQTITWTSAGTVGNVKIEYSIDNGENWTEIVASTENDDSFPWTVPNVDSNQCLIRVSETDGSPADASDAVFTIFPPSITVTSPNGGENWEVNSQQTITWTSTGTVGNVKIEYSLDNGDNWTEIAASTPNDGSHLWTVPETPANQCLVRVSETDGSPADTSDAVFTIFSPSITVTSPNGGENWNVGSVYAITWTSEGTIGNVIIEYSINGGSTWKKITASTENDGSYNWLIPNRPSDKCLIRVSANDADESTSDISDNVFSIVSFVPGSIIVRSPNGGESWAVGSSQEIKWNSSGDINHVSIKYSTDNGTTWKTVTQTTTNDGSFNWTIPDTVSDECLVQVTAGGGAGDSWPADVSDSVFSIVLPSSPPTITVIAPNGGEQLIAGSSIHITWLAVNMEYPRKDVKIEYSVNGGQDWTIITEAVDNNGDYHWLVPDTPSDNCLVRIGEIDGQPEDVSDAVFAIVSPTPGDITVTSPNGGETWEVGSSYEIKWDSTGIDLVTIEYSQNNGNTWKTIVQTTPNSGSFDWTTPDTASEECLVRITSNDGGTDPRPSDVSNSVFSIVFSPPPTIKVTAPNGGEQLQVGSRFDITWLSSGTREDVKIEYSVTSGDTWMVIADAAENNGKYDWLVPDTPSETCLVRIGETDGQPMDISDAVFSIVQPIPGEITVTSPNGGENWTADSTQEIKWTGSGDINSVNIKYSTDNGVTWNVIVQTTANDGSFDWTIPDTASDECLVRITSNDGGTDPRPSDVSDDVFSIVSSSPSFRLTSPNGGESWEVGSVHAITWNSTGTTSDIMIDYSFDNGNTWSIIVSSTENSGSYDWSVPDTVSEECLVRVTANDGGGDPKPSDVSDEVFSIVLPPSPTITVIAPNGGEELTVGSSFNITWYAIGPSEDVKIEYTDNGGETWTEITNATQNDGDYNWIIPDTPSETCLVRISEIDEEPVDISDAVFSIVSPIPGDIIVTSPNGGESLEAGSQHAITWDSSGIDNVVIKYSTDNGVTWTTIGPAPAPEGIYNWVVPETPSETCLVQVTATDAGLDPRPSDVSDQVFSIVLPYTGAIRVDSPNGGETLTPGTEYDITWTSTGVNSVIIEYSVDNGAEWIYIDTVTASEGRYTWTVPQTSSQTCLIRISGNTPGEPPFDVSDEVFTISI